MPNCFECQLCFLVIHLGLATEAHLYVANGSLENHIKSMNMITEIDICLQTQRAQNYTLGGSRYKHDISVEYQPPPPQWNVLFTNTYCVEHLTSVCHGERGEWSRDE